LKPPDRLADMMKHLHLGRSKRERAPLTLHVPLKLSPAQRKHSLRRVYIDQEGLPIIISHAVVRRLAFELTSIPEEEDATGSVDFAIPDFFTIDMNVSPDCGQVTRVLPDQDPRLRDPMPLDWPPLAPH
jgi:hypothetical protein